MAGSSNVLTYVLLGGAAYVAYKYFTGTTTLVPAPVASTGTTPVVGPAVPPPATGPTTLQKLQAAGGTGALNADQWSYYWSQIGKPAIDPVTFNSAFFPNGRPDDATQNPTMTADAFIAALATKGLSGLLPRPVFVSRNRGFGGYGLADFRRAGGRY